MNIQELQTMGEKIVASGGTRDTFARRRLNVNPDTVANITAEEIEKGQVTIEQMEALNTDVLIYSTQLTIHGKLPDIKNNHDAMGYKSLIVNGNGSLGVKFTAIDAKKKQNIARMIDIWYSEHKAFAQASSQGFIIARGYGSFESTQKDKYLEAIEKAKIDLEAMPKCFYGSARLAQVNNWGLLSLYLICDLGAIYEKDVETLASWFTGHTAEETQAKLEEKRIKDEKEKKEREARWEEAKRLDDIKKQAIIDQLAFECKSNPPTGYHGEGTYLYKVAVRSYETSSYVIKCGEITYKKTSKGYSIQYNNEKAKFYDKEAFDKIIASPAKKLWKKEDPKKEVVKAVLSEGATVTHNTEKNGVEIAFSKKPSQATIDSLKANGFRWSYGSGLWYTKYSQKSIDFANSIVA